MALDSWKPIKKLGNQRRRRRVETFDDSSLSSPVLFFAFTRHEPYFFPPPSTNVIHPSGIMKRHNAPHSTGKEKKKEEEEKKGEGGGKEKKRGTTDALPFTLISRRECEFRPMILFFLSRASQSSSITTDFHVSPNYAPPPSGFVRNYRDFERVHAALSLISFFQTVFKSVSKSLNEDLVFERVAQME